MLVIILLLIVILISLNSNEIKQSIERFTKFSSFTRDQINYGFNKWLDDDRLLNKEICEMTMDRNNSIKNIYPPDKYLMHY